MGEAQHLWKSGGLIPVGAAAACRSGAGASFGGLQRRDEGRWVRRSLVDTPLCWGLFPAPHVALPHFLRRLTLSPKP